VKRGELYLVRKPGSPDPKKRRVFVIVSRQALIDSRFSTVVCAPVYSKHDGVSTQVVAGTAEGLKKESSIHCDELISVPKSLLTYYVGSLKISGLLELDKALAVAVGLEDPETIRFLN
jgi:mRNA interferase MazF